VKETVAYCDLDEKDARRPGVATLKIDVDGVIHVMDVCQVHLTLLGRLPTGSAARGRRGGRRVAKRVAAAPAKKATKRAAKAAPARKRVAVKAVKATKATKAPAKRAAKATRATKAVRGTAVRGTAGRVSGSRRDQQQQIAAAREWARAQGRSIADKGRLPAGLVEEFTAATR
jgi:hypothetical protein